MPALSSVCLSILEEDLHPIDMVSVEVCEYDGHNGLGSDPPELRQHLPGSLGALHGVNDDDPLLALDHDAVSEAEVDGHKDVVVNGENLPLVEIWCFFLLCLRSKLNSIFLDLNKWTT